MKQTSQPIQFSPGISIFSNSVLLGLAVLPGIWAFLYRPASKFYLLALLLISITAIPCLCGLIRNILTRRPFFDCLLSQRPFFRIMDIVVFSAVIWIIRESFQNPWIAYAFSFPLVTVVAFRLLRNCRQSLPAEEFHLIKDAYLAFILGVFGLLSVAGLRSLAFLDPTVLKSALKLIGSAFPIAPLLAGYVLLLVPGSASLEERLMRTRFLRGAVSLILVAHLLIVSWAMFDYVTGQEDPASLRLGAATYKRLCLAEKTFRFYRLSPLARKARVDILSFVNNDERRFNEIPRIISETEALFPELREVSVRMLATESTLQNARTKKVYFDVWRDLEFGPLGECLIMDRWGRIFLTPSPDRLELFRDSPLWAVDSPIRLTDAVDFEFSPDKKTIMILDSQGNLYAQGVEEGMAAFRFVGKAAVQVCAKDLEWYSAERFFVLDGCGNVWSGMPMQRNPVPAEPLWDWDIARALQLDATGDPLMLDGRGGVHLFGGAQLPGDKANVPYWDRTRGADLELNLAKKVLCVLDNWGDLYLCASPYSGITKSLIRADPHIPFAVDVELTDDCSKAFVLSRGGIIREIAI